MTTKEYNRDYYIKNIDKLKAQGQEWVKNNREKSRAYKKKYRTGNPERYKLVMRQWRLKNLKEVRRKKAAYAKKRYEKNSRKILDVKLAYMKRRRQNDPEYRIKEFLRSYLSRVIKRGARKTARTKEYLGCELSKAREHIESLWLPGMSWDNHTLEGWHIDHIRPLSSFDFTQPEQIFAALHYTNLQPLWAVDNLRKSNKF